MKGPMSAATKKKLAAAMRRRWKHARANGTAPNVATNGHAKPARRYGAASLKTVRAEMVELAHVGARLRVAELERELEKLRIFLGK